MPYLSADCKFNIGSIVKHKLNDQRVIIVSVRIDADIPADYNSYTFPHVTYLVRGHATAELRLISEYELEDIKEVEDVKTAEELNAEL